MGWAGRRPFTDGARECGVFAQHAVSYQHLRIVQSVSGLDAGMLAASQLANQYALSAARVEWMLSGRVGV